MCQKKILRFCVILYFFSIFSFCFGNEYFNDDGRSDLTVQVESPVLKNIGSEAEWLPDFVVNTISDDIAKYSNIKIVDVHNESRMLDTQKRDEQSGYSDEETYKALNFEVAKNVLLVSITGKNSSYALSVRINDKEKNISIASYNNPNCLYVNLESGIAIKEAVADILGQLGVKLTDNGKKALLYVKSDVGSVTSSIQAQKLVAQGKMYEQKGSNIQALSYYVQAGAADKTLKRAFSSMIAASTAVASGDFGTQARNLIQQRKDFKELIESATKLFENDLPYYIVFDSEPKMGKINYEKETFDYSVKAAVVKDIEREVVYKNIIQAYESQPDSKNWKLDGELRSIWPDDDYLVDFELRDKNGAVIGKSRHTFRTDDSLRNFATWGTVSINVSANSDTDGVILSIPSVAKKGKEIKPVEMSRITFKDYLNNIFVKSFKLSEVVPGIAILTLPNAGSSDDCNAFF